MPDQNMQINVNVDPKDLKGRYANAVSVTSQERDVVIDFMSHVNMQGNHQAQLVSRVFLNHFTAKSLIETLQNTISQWEKLRYEGSNQNPKI
jgi:uncharacterized protein DUF3467